MDTLAAPPFVPPVNPELKNYWMMSQRAGSVTYTTFAAGFAAGGVRAVPGRLRPVRAPLEVPGLIRKTGGLVAYVIHDLIDGLVGPFLPKDAPLWYVLAAFGVYLALITLFLRYLDRNGIVFRL